MDDFTYTLGQVSDQALADLARDFDSLGPNDYADGRYRFRRFSAFSFDRANGIIALKPPHDFVQSGRFNHFQPGVARHYDDLLPSTYGTPGAVELFSLFARDADLPELATVEVHQMRVVSNAPGDVAPVAPEGVHRDGFDRIAMLTVDRSNATGGDLSLYAAEDAEPFLTLPCRNGQYVVVNDRALWHTGSPVQALESERPGTWDVFVLTANRA